MAIVGAGFRVGGRKGPIGLVADVQAMKATRWWGSSSLFIMLKLICGKGQKDLVEVF